jgi:hypothetical protein
MQCVHAGVNLHGVIENISHNTAKMNDNWIGHDSILSAITHKLNISGNKLIWSFFLWEGGGCETCAWCLFAPFSYTLYVGMHNIRFSSSLNSASRA